MGIMLYMNDETFDSSSTIKSFLAGSDDLKLSIPKDQRYAWLAKTLKCIDYLRLSKKDKGSVRYYLQSVTDYSRAQLTRLIKQHQRQGRIGKKSMVQHQFARCVVHGHDFNIKTIKQQRTTYYCT